MKPLYCVPRGWEAIYCHDVSPTGKRSGLYWQHGVNGGLTEAFHKGE